MTVETPYGVSTMGGSHGTDETSQQVETSMSLKLFAIRLPDGSLLTDTHGQPVYYDDKKEAKRIRDRRGDDGVIGLGPDHSRYGNN